MTKIHITILSKENCTYCDQAKALFQRLQSEYPLQVSIIDLNTSEGETLARDAGFLFPPGIFVDNEPFSYGRPSERQWRRELDRRLKIK